MLNERKAFFSISKYLTFAGLFFRAVFLMLYSKFPLLSVPIALRVEPSDFFTKEKRAIPSRICRTNLARLQAAFRHSLNDGKRLLRKKDQAFERIVERLNLDAVIFIHLKD